MKIEFTKVETIPASLEKNWRNSLLLPNDGPLESELSSASKFLIRRENKALGFAQTSANGILHNFFTSEEFSSDSASLFSEFVANNKIRQALSGTNNPIFYSLCESYATKKSEENYLFEPNQVVHLPDHFGLNSRMANEQDLDRLITFCVRENGDDENWLRPYLTNLITHHQIQLFLLNEELIAFTEMRKNHNSEKYSFLGVMVEQKFRNQGIGSYCLSHSANHLLNQHQIPLCSCEAGNITSSRMIIKSGFQKAHTLYRFELANHQ